MPDLRVRPLLDIALHEQVTGFLGEQRHRTVKQSRELIALQLYLQVGVFLGQLRDDLLLVIRRDTRPFPTLRPPPA